MTYNIDDIVTCEEHGGIGRVLRIMPAGVTVEFTYEPKPHLPFGLINNEFWINEDLHMLKVIA